MNYFGIDVFNNIDRLKEIIEKRKKESKKWNDICKSKDSLLDFLRKYIHKK
jgi:hypothetical protein